MDNNKFWLKIIGLLDKVRSKREIKKNLKELGGFHVSVIPKIGKTKAKAQIKKDLAGVTATVNADIKVDGKKIQIATKNATKQAQEVANKNKVKIPYSFEVDKKKFQNQLTVFSKEHSKLFTSKEMTAKFNQLVDSASIAKSRAELKGLRGQLSAFRTELMACGKAGMTWTDKFKASISHFTQYFSGASFIYAVTNQLRNAWTEAKTLDDKLVDLQKVTDEIEERKSLYKYFDKALDKANKLNVKVGSLISAITEFKKMGWSLSDAELGGEWATKLSNVGDVDIETAIGSIKTAVASFDKIGGYGNDQMNEKLEAYVDLINNMSNKHSIDAQGLAEAIRLSAGTLTEANTTIEEAATIFATANKYYNDPDYLGNTIKIGALRLRATTGDDSALDELSEMGEDIQEVTALTGKLREELLTLTGVDIMVDNNTFKSYYQQLKEISEVIDELDDTSSAKVLETLFGKNRAAAGMSVLSGLQESEKAYEDAINSAGSSTEEYTKWMSGADAACQRFSNSLTELYQSFINGNTVRDLADMGATVLTFANNWGLVEGAVKSFLALKIGTFITNGTMAMVSATKQVERYGKALQLANSIPNGNLAQRYSTLRNIAQATSSLSTAQLKQVLSSKKLTQQDRVRILQMQGMTKEMALQKLTEMNLTQATNAQTVANNAQTKSTFRLKSAMTGLGATIKGLFLSNAVGITIMAIGTAFSAITSGISSANQKAEEARQKAKDAASSVSGLGDEIVDLTTKYLSLSEAVDVDNSAKENLMATQTELLKKLQAEGKGLDDLIAKYGTLNEAIRQLTLEELSNMENDLIAGVKATEEELLKIGKGYKHWYSVSNRNILSSGGESAVKAYEVLDEAGVISSGSYGSGGGSIVLIGDDSTVSGILENYQKLQDAMRALRESGEFTEEELKDNPVFEQLYNRSKEMEEYVNSYNTAISDLNKNSVQQMMLTSLKGTALPNTTEEFEKFRDELVKTAQSSTDFIGTAEDIEKAVNNYLSTVSEFSWYYSQALQNVNNAVSKEPEAITVLAETQIEKINEYQEKLNALYEALNLLQSGVMTPKDIDALIDKFPELSDDTEDLETAIKSLIDNALLAMGDIYGSLLDNVAEFAVKQNAVEHSISTTASAIDSITSAYQSLNKAIEEYNENGYVSLDTLKQMMTMQPQYLQALVDEKGNLLANAEAYKKLLILKLDEWRLDIHRKQDLEREEHAEEIKKLTMQYNGGEITAEEWKKRYNEITDGDYYQATIDAINSIHMNIDKVLEDVGSGGSGSSASKSKNTLDWLTVSLDNLNEKVNDFQNELKNADGIEAQKKAIDSLNKELQKLQNTYYSYDDNSNTVYGEYQKRYNEALSKLGKDSSSIKSKIEAETVFDTQEFSAEVTKIVNEAIDAWNGMKDSHNKYLEIGVQIDENLDKAYDLELKKILGDFDNAISHFENKEKLINSKLSNAEANGIIALENYYKELQKVENSTYEEIKKNQAELNRLMEDSNLEKGSDEWHNLQKEIEEANIAMQDSINSIAELDKKLREIRWDKFDFSREQESLLIDEADFLMDLLDKSDAYDEIGNITNEGLAKMGLYAANYNAYMEQSIKYTLELKEVQKELEKAPTDTKLMDRYNELVERQREAILSSESLKESMVNLVTEGIDLNKSAMRDLIDSYLEAGESARDLYNWQKRSAESTKRIASIQKQLSVYSGQNTEEARMMTQKLKLQLEEETSNYEEQLMEKHLEDQREILNTLYDNYEIALNNYLSDTARVVSDSIDRVNDSNGVINDTIKTEAEKVGVEISDEMKDIWSKEDSVLSDGFEGVADNVDKNTGVLEAFDAKMESLLREMESAVDLQLHDVTEDTEAMSGQLSGINDKATSMNNNLQNISNQLDAIVGKMDKANTSDGSPATPTVGGSTGAVSGSVTFKSKKSSYDKSKLNTDTSLVDLLKYHDFDSSKTARADYYSQMGFEDVYKDTPTQNIAMLEWLKRNGYKANEYASGGKNLSKQLAWTQENGELEYIIRPSDGAILTPVPQNGMVLNSEASKRLWEMTNNPTSFFADIVKGGFAIDIPKSTVSNNNHVDVQLNAEFVLPNARTYSEIMTEMQHDRKFEGMIKDIVGSSLPGGSAFRKNRHSW